MRERTACLLNLPGLNLWRVAANTWGRAVLQTFDNLDKSINTGAISLVKKAEWFHLGRSKVHKYRTDTSWQKAVWKNERSEGSAGSQAEQGLLSWAEREFIILSSSISSRNTCQTSCRSSAVLWNTWVQRHVQVWVLLLGKGWQAKQQDNGKHELKEETENRRCQQRAKHGEEQEKPWWCRVGAGAALCQIKVCYKTPVKQQLCTRQECHKQFWLCCGRRRRTKWSAGTSASLLKDSVPSWGWVGFACPQFALMYHSGFTQQLLLYICIISALTSSLRLVVCVHLTILGLSVSQTPHQSAVCQTSLTHNSFIKSHFNN